MINSFKGDYSWLSNMADCEINYKGWTFKSVENAYMWAKNPNDEAWLDFCLTNSPAECKKRAKTVALRHDWEEVKLSVMFELLKLKFSQKRFKEKLLATGTENIVEGNYWNDKFWGVCLKSNPNVGENYLGRLIMEVRTLLKKGKL